MSIIDEKIKQMAINFQNESIERKVKFDEYLKDTKNDFDQSMVKQFLQKFKKYEKVERSFSKYFNTEDLDSIMDSKVDIEMLNEVKQDKASRDELK
jgi:hypothetical protein